MVRRNASAGGFFLVAAMFAGGVVGIVRGAPMQGILVGTAVGIAAALAVWLIDRRSR